MYTIKSEIPSVAMEPAESTMGDAISIVRLAQPSFLRKEIFLSPHRKNYYLFVYTTEASGRHWIDMTPYDVKAGTFYFTRPDQIHLKEEEEITGVAISFTDTFLAGGLNQHLSKLPIIENLLNAHELLLNTTDKAYIEDLLSKLLVEYQGENRLRTEMLYAYMSTLLIFTSRLYTEQYVHDGQSVEKKILNVFQSHIETMYKSTHQVAEYAKEMNLSVNQLHHIVKTQSGKPPLAHIHERLILESKRLLFHSSHSIKEIAFELGFEDASYFNRFFKRLTAVTPLAYRKMRLEFTV
ncbi:helix-turn-helix transcriptional regulator [Sphingobacterium oryzagri]|uniref:Helix-turn-helix transcriptional regulator n=1 Tax=Sphingobacterium oryzagri TaxID=3025669 RepID=A0ABY7WBN8_9SPHI|nr:helix-turn-helix domain-containing protein [Sphingobacterium sp. KACC 22765]WDF66872.1 helix-turn-helix transcriptional regulator [Sphingobacterium sp. KACC 22765]